MKDKSNLIFIFLIVAFVLYMIFGAFERNENESKLENSGKYFAVEIVEINYGVGSTQVEYSFFFKGRKYNKADICNFDQVKRMNIGDIYLCKFNLLEDFAKLNCDCRIQSSYKGRSWDSEPEICR